jgi:hypothetical protein
VRAIPAQKRSAFDLLAKLGVGEGFEVFHGSFWLVGFHTRFDIVPLVS